MLYDADASVWDEALGIAWYGQRISHNYVGLPKSLRSDFQGHLSIPVYMQGQVSNGKSKDSCYIYIYMNYRYMFFKFLLFVKFLR